MGKNKKESSLYIGPKMKVCFVLIWAFQLFLTWLILESNISIFIQAIVLIASIIIIYIQLVLMQDYFYVKKHSEQGKFRRDVRILEPLLPKRLRKK